MMTGNFFDELISVQPENVVTRWSNRVLIFGLMLFALSLPHSIAASYISLSLCAVSWIVRDLSARKFHFTRTPLDKSLLGFIGFSVLSSLLSAEPKTSISKLQSLVVFGVIYLVASNLSKRAVNFLLVLLLISTSAGVVFSLGEKIFGRGMIVTSINEDSPLRASNLQSGDVIWMIGRTRVRSLEAANQLIKNSPANSKLEIEALHDGDPLPVSLQITDEIKSRTNPLGANVDGASRRFRVSGFSRHFLTYAEQLQILGLLLLGFLIAHSPHRLVTVSLFFLFSLALILTASRAVIASYLAAVVITVLLTASRRIAMITIAAVFLTAVFASYAVLSTRNLSSINFSDDSSSRRIGYMKAGLRLIPQHPIFGVGMDAHKKHWNEWGFPGDYITHTHSTPIQIAMDRGLPALFCLGWFLFSIGWMSWRSYKETKSVLALGTLAAVIGFSLSSFFNYNFGDSEVVLLLLFLVGLINAEARTQ
jgi:O-Antigen ligase/PDZ domain